MKEEAYISGQPNETASTGEPLTDPQISSAVRSTAEILLAAAAAKVAVSAILKKRNVPRRPLPSVSPLTQMLMTGDLTLGFKLSGQNLFAFGEKLEQFLGIGKKPAPETGAEEVAEEAVAEEATEETAVPMEEEEPAAEVFATVEQVEEEPVADEAAAEEPTETAVSEDGEEGEGEEEGFAGFDSSQLHFIDVKAEPEAYEELLRQEAAGEVTLVTRYRKSYESRLLQSVDPVQEYYSGIKNAFLSYKGVKGRVSWGNETFNRGRIKLAKINAKTRTLYLYLALNPEELKEGKYNVEDLSDKKKFESVPALIKIRGERKYKYALELIAKLCGEDQQLPPNKKFEEQDYRRPYQSTEELVENGLIRKLVAGVPVQAPVAEAE